MKNMLKPLQKKNEVSKCGVCVKVARGGRAGGGVDGGRERAGRRRGTAGGGARAGHCGWRLQLGRRAARRLPRQADARRLQGRRQTKDRR